MRTILFTAFVTAAVLTILSKLYNHPDFYSPLLVTIQTALK